MYCKKESSSFFIMYISVVFHSYRYLDFLIWKNNMNIMSNINLYGDISDWRMTTKASCMNCCNEDIQHHKTTSVYCIQVSCSLTLQFMSLKLCLWIIKNVHTFRKSITNEKRNLKLFNTLCGRIPSLCSQHFITKGWKFQYFDVRHLWTPLNQLLGFEQLSIFVIWHLISKDHWNCVNKATKSFNLLNKIENIILIDFSL